MKTFTGTLLGIALLALLSCCSIPLADQFRTLIMPSTYSSALRARAGPPASAQQFSAPLLLEPAKSPRPTSLHNRLERSRQPTTNSFPPPQPKRVDVLARSTHTDGSSAVPVQQQRPTRFAKYGITGDGSCMFRACVQGHHQLQHAGQQLASSQEYSKALALRQAVVEELRKNREDMEPFLPGIADDFDDYLAKMAQPGVWGGEPELLTASRVLQRPVCVYQAAWGGPQYILTYGEEFEKSAAPMHLLWSGAHYDLLVSQPMSKL